MVQRTRITNPARPGTRQNILNAARELFAQNGYSATSVRMIARKAGLTDPALYYYFPTKRELHDTLLREPEYRDLQPEAGPATLAEAIEALVAVFTRYSQEADMIRLSLREQINGEPTAVQFFEDSGERYRNFARALFQPLYGDATEEVVDVAAHTVSGLYWDGLLRFGQNFEKVVAGAQFQARIRAILAACLPPISERR